MIIMKKKNKNIWPSDGENYDVDDNVFFNQSIRDFVESDAKTFIISPKGMGKTLLLKKKRKFVDVKKSGVFIIPENTLADYVSFPASVSDKWLSILEKFENWKIIWEFGFYISILSIKQFRTQIQSGERRNIASGLSGHFADFIDTCLDPDEGHHVFPSEVINKIISLNFSEFHHLANFSQNYLTPVCSRVVHSSVYIFVDGVDNSLRSMLGRDQESFNPNVWCAGQLGLMHAGWNIGRFNQHIKVCASIRQEAFVRSFDEDSQAMSGLCSFIRYSKPDICKMMDLLVSNYENFEDFERLIGFSSVSNKMVEENIYDYLYRHMLGKPRGLALIGARLREQFVGYRDTDEAVTHFRRVINDVTAKEIVENYLIGEMKYFMKTLYSEEYIDGLFKIIPTNILSGEDVNRIQANFQQMFHFSDNNCNPFSELYNLGLLARIKNDPIQSNTIQSFSPPHKFKWDAGDILPESEWYLIHPALSEAIRSKNPQYKSNERIIVGNGREWNEEMDRFANEQRVRIFVSYSRKDAKLVDRCLGDLARRFDEKGIAHWFWRDEWRLRAGDWVHDEIEKGIQSCDYVLVFLTRNAMSSGWVEREWKSRFQHDLDSSGVSVVPITNMSSKEVSSLSGPFLNGIEVKKIPARSPGEYSGFVDRLVGNFYKRHLDAKVEAKKRLEAADA